MHSFGDVHLYVNHIPQARLQLARATRPLPRLTIARRAGSIFGYRFDDLQLEGYEPHPGIKAQVAV